MGEHWENRKAMVKLFGGPSRLREKDVAEIYEMRRAKTIYEESKGGREISQTYTSHVHGEDLC